ncbi:MAG: hypothetical protein NVSMB9_00010 [Isosphaeraceae bacterium]
MNQTDESLPLTTSDQSDLNEMLSLFDSPAFVRRGQDVEYARRRLHQQLSRDRLEMLDMVRVRLRQWSAVATGLDDWEGIFIRPLDQLLVSAGAEPPVWAARPGTPRRRLAVARDLVASAERFNRRWLQTLDGLNLDVVNRRIDLYNRYYLLEKECVLGSARLAARHFASEPLLTCDALLAIYPTLPNVALSR